MLSVARFARIALACAGLTLPQGANALSLGQVDDFEDGTTQGWAVGPPHPAPPANVASGGPAGAGDNYMQLTAIGGASAGSRLAAFNISQWSGDYLAAGITGFSIDLNNLGSTDLSLRLGISDGGSNAAISGAVTLLAGSGWTNVQVRSRRAISSPRSGA